MPTYEKIRIDSIRLGNKEVFMEIYKEYVDNIYRFIGYKVSGKSNIEDITSEVFYKAFQGITKCCEQENPNIKAWLYMIASNTIVDFYRKQHDCDVNIDMEGIIVDSSIDKEMDVKIQTEYILQHLKTLGEDIYDIFIMRFWQQLSYEEISIVNGKSTANNKQIFSRTMKKLTTHFDTF